VGNLRGEAGTKNDPNCYFAPIQKGPKVDPHVLNQDLLYFFFEPEDVGSNLNILIRRLRIKIFQGGLKFQNFKQIKQAVETVKNSTGPTLLPRGGGVQGPNRKRGEREESTGDGKTDSTYVNQNNEAW